MFNSYSMTQFARGIADALGAEAPLCSAESIPSVRQFVNEKLQGRADRVLIYNPDCLGLWFWQKYTAMYEAVEKHVQLTVPLSTVMPSVTPVCFGTMYTGAMPAVHGIQKYEKPVIRIDSLFDSLRRSGKRVAVVVVQESSMARIFAERDIDYYVMPYDGEVVEKALELIEEDRYDLIAVYNQEYDDMIHTHTPECPEAMQAARNHIAAFDRLATAVEERWTNHNSLIVWASDHGCHLEESGHGNHGEYIEEDINMVHFYGAVPAK